MNTAAKNPDTKRFLIDVFSLKRWAELQKKTSLAEFYQHLASEIIKGARTMKVLSEVGNGLINLADHAYTHRRMDALERINQILLNLPLDREFRMIARYYQGLAVKRNGEFDRAQALFERVAEEAPIKYKARAIIALGSVAFDRGDFQSALPFYIEGHRTATHTQVFDPLAAFYTQHMMAVLKSIDGDNRGALADLESMFPLVRAVGSTFPSIYCNYLNSLAVELAEAGRLDEAERACQFALAPWFANAYPEVSETWRDIALKRCRASRSFVSYARRGSNTENVLQLHAPDRDNGFSRASPRLFHPQQPARILNYSEFKKKMVKEPNGDENVIKSPQDMTEKELFLRAMELFANTKIPEKKRRKMLEAIEKIVAEPEQD